ncbi:restriction endonuclease [Citromicrobium sp. JLT1363]|uniref:restriction endonuclease n=1 Tax=Citromicrobium sp. JLT1363 TaxID=517722 RepID=UPI0009FF2DC9|nr:restriction endonuclease [Citromicrobium sp. JLT1363]
MSAETLLRAIVIGEGWAEGEEAAENAEKWASKFLERARTFLNRAVEDGTYQHYCFNSGNPDYLQGSCYCEPGDDAEVLKAKRRRANTLKLYQAISARTADDLELLCVKLLRLLGVSRPNGTPRAGDGGVDFYGYSNFGFILKPEILPAGAEKHMRVWFVGQAKHYDASQVGTKDIREIVGSVSLARAKLFAGEKDPMRQFSARLCEPVFSMFITTGRFSRDSKDLMKKSGIIPMDGPQLGQFLADNGIGLTDDLFDQNEFDDWISQEEDV